MIDPGIGHHKAEPMLDNQQTRAMAHDPFRFGQHHFDKARVFVDLCCKRDRALRGLDRRHVHVTSLGLRDDLLRHHQHIAGFRHQPIRRKCGSGDFPQIVTRLDELYPKQRGKRQLGGGHLSSPPPPFRPKLALFRKIGDL